MANYTKATDFASKDDLLSGDPNKVVRGSEINDEFSNIQTAVNSKANITSPEFEGTPLAPTASFGTNSTQIATTAFVQAALVGAYPVGSIYLSTTSTNPATTFGFGTWVEFGAGKVLVGQDAGDTSFDTLEETGGSKDAIVVEHTHTVTDPGHLHTFNGGGGGGSNLRPTIYGDVQTPYTVNTSTATTGISISSTGSSGTNANLQPYVVVKMWKRTA